MKAYRAEVRQRAAAAGRDPDTVKLLFLANPLVDTTLEAAQERRRLIRDDANRHLDMQLSGMSRLTNIDFSKFDPVHRGPPVVAGQVDRQDAKKVTVGPFQQQHGRWI